MANKRKPIDVAVLNSIAAAAADLALAGGKMSCTGLSDTIKLSDGISYTKTAYAAGTLSQKTVDFTAISLAANTAYRLAIVVPDAKDFSGGGREANQLIPIREYVVYSGDSAPTATEIATAFKERINLDLQRKVDASSAAALLTLDLIKLTEGDFFISDENAPAGAVVATVTPFVAPSGTPELVEAVAPTQSIPTGEYTTYVITINKLFRHAAISGLQCYKDVDIYIFAEENDADFGDFETALDAILDGSHTPVADYLGI